MATRTRYRRTRTGVAFGGAFWRFDPASQTPGLGGAVAGGRSGFEPPIPRVAADRPNNPLSGILAMGGTVVGTMPDGTPVVSVGGLLYNGATGQPLPNQNGAAGAGTAATGAPAPNGTTATAATSRVGTAVTGRTASGATVNGTITGTDANGNTIVQWQDGTVSTYDGTGKLVSNTAAPGAAAGAGAGAAGAGGGPAATTTDTAAAPASTVAPPVTDPSNPNAPSTYSLPPDQPAAAPPPPSPGPVAAGNPAQSPTYIADQGVSGGLNGTAAHEPGLYDVTPAAQQVFFPPPNAATAQGDTALTPGISYADVVPNATPAPSPSIAAPQLYGDQYGNMVTLEQLLAGYQPPPSTLVDAQTMAAPDIAAPTPYPGYAQLDPGYVEPAPAAPPPPPPDYSAFAQ